MQKPTIILASASIGRKQLLEKLGVPFEVIVSTIDEDKISGKTPQEKLANRARAKAEDVFKRLASRELASRKKTSRPYTLVPSPYLIIIAADSEAILGHETFGKAKDKNDAQRILKSLMGKTHEFTTATSIVLVKYLRSPKPVLNKVEGSLKEIRRWETITTTRVTLRSLDANSLALYLSKYDFTRFAAGYALNETPWDLVTKIDGSYTNVVGLPFEELLPVLRLLKLLR